jgi:hypothetical protein
VAAALLASAAAGCTELGVKEVEPNSYFLTQDYSRFLFDSARQKGMSRAAEFCLKMDRRVLVDYVVRGPINKIGAGTAEVNFRCLYPGDPELQRTQFPLSVERQRA